MKRLQHNLHLLWRAGFGPAAAQLPQLNGQSPSATWEQLRSNSSTAPGYLDVMDQQLKDLLQQNAGGARIVAASDPEARRMLAQLHRRGIRNLNLAWMRQLAGSKAQLREKMAFFWHGHFATRSQNLYFQQQLLHTIRTHATGSFRTLLHGVARSGAMLQFLNANQNRKDHPNENFARELMELFTLGRGAYTEQDVKEVARAFTGWSADARGNMVLRQQQHDYGTKTILGRSGNFDGAAVLDLLLEQPRTAQHLTYQLCRFFVQETPDPKMVQRLANILYRSDYELMPLLEALFTEEYFFRETHIGSRIKSPVELLTGIQRMLQPRWEQEEALLLMQKTLGQVLFNPPNVAGWPGGKTWIDSSTLIARMRLPLLLAQRDEWNLAPKADDDNEMGKRQPLGWRKGGLPAVIHWDSLRAALGDVPEAQLAASLSQYLLVTPPGAAARQAIRNSGTTRQELISSLVPQLMALPEYQLC